MHRKPMGGINKHGKHSITWSEKREGYAWGDPASGDASRVVTPEQGLVGIERNHTTTNPLRASSMAKPSSREANANIKYRSKQA